LFPWFFHHPLVSEIGEVKVVRREELIFAPMGKSEKFQNEKTALNELH
jgi:hypothetical protein